MSTEHPTAAEDWEGHDALGGEPSPEPPSSAPEGPPEPAPGAAPGVPKVVVPRWIQLVALPLGIVALYLVAKAAGVVLLAFTVAAVIALILNPMVAFLQ